MHNVEVEIMALSAQREHDLRKHMEVGRVLQDLRKQAAQSERSSGTIAVFYRRRVFDLLQHCRWRLSAFPRREREANLCLAAE